jgi:hypothetical protein
MIQLIVQAREDPYMESIESLEAELAREGRLDSEGVFTIDLLARSRKLAVMQIQQPSLFVFKLLQAAVAVGSPCFRMEVSVAETCVDFELPRSEVATNFSQLLDQDLSSQARWLRHLVAGVQFALAAESRSLQLTFDDGHCRHTIEVSGGQLQQYQADSEETGFWLKMQSMQTRWWKFWSDPPALARLKKDLAHRAGFAPICLIFNGKALPAQPLDAHPDLKLIEAPAGWTETPCGTNWLLEWLGPVEPQRDCGAWSSPLARVPRLLRVGNTQVWTGDGNLTAKGATRTCPVAVSRWHFEQEPVFCPKRESQRYVSWFARQQPLLLRIARSELSTDPIAEAMVGLRKCAGFYADRGSRRAGPPEPQSLVSLGADHHSSVKFGWAALQRNLPNGEALLFLVQDGICLDPIPVTGGPPGAVAILVVTELAVDAGQLTAVVDSPTVLEAISWAKGTWRKQLQELSEIVTEVRTCESLRLVMSIREGWRNWLADLRSGLTVY